ncbi:MAG: thrombospondin type 3 repeat-containing protein [Desulfobacterales bacterium]|nr:thrombospondin type 3 repeat-containing protein [Desulfobacterales bacterium]
MKNNISDRTAHSRAISITAVLFFSILLSFSPFTASAQMEEINNGISWLMSNQNPSGSWGNSENTELRDTTVVADILKKVSSLGDKYNNAISFLNNTTTPNNDYLARKIAVLAQEGSDVTSLIDELLAGQNPGETDNTTPNYPEGGWGPAEGYSTNCLDTSLALNAMSFTSVPKGLLILNKTITAGETQEFSLDYPADASNFQILVSDISGSINFILFPNDSSTYYTWGPIASSTYLNAEGITIEPGIRRIQIYGNATSTYSLQISLTSGGYDSSALVNPVAYLIAAQNIDGGWGLSKGSDSNIYLTARVLMALETSAESFDLESVIGNGIAWLKTQQNADNGFGSEGTSTIYETALVYTAIANVELSATEVQNTLAYLLSQQESNGSWNNNAYDTAVSILAIYTSMLETDTDGDGVPDLSDNCPDIPNSDQINTDGDQWGDACDDDDDNDGITDDYEINTLGTNPLSADSDGDGIPDNLEDMDFDGITNQGEFDGGTDPMAPDVHLTKGINIVGYPVSVPTGYTSYDLLNELGDETEIVSIQRYNTATGIYETTYYENGAASGDEFTITDGEGYIVYMNADKTVSITGPVSINPVSLSEGFNIVSISCMPNGYSSYDLLSDIGSGIEAVSIQRFNKSTGAFETTVNDSGFPSGVQFNIFNSEAYLVHMKSAATIPALLSAPTLVITSPADGATIESSPIDVSGTINDSAAVVTVNGISAIIAEGNFVAAGVPLVSGSNTITATAMNTDNLSHSHTITVLLDEGADYEISKGSSISDTRSITGAEELLSEVAYFTESVTDLPTGITYTRTGIGWTSATELWISYTIQVSVSAAEGIHEFQVEYGLLDSGNNPLTPLTNNVFSFKIMVVIP